MLKNIIVTGGASGLGMQLTKYYLDNGANVICLDQNNPNLAEIDFYKVDLIDPKSLENACAEIKQKYSIIDILINNAGMIIVKPFEESTYTDILQQMNVNLLGAIHITKLIGQIMIDNQSHGNIVNVCSTDGIVSQKRHKSELDVMQGVVYAASKGGLITFTKALAAEWGPKKIRVNSVSPTIMRTPMTEELLNNPEKTKEYSSILPLSQTLETQDVVEAISFLADNKRASKITGHNLVIDSGYFGLDALI